MTEPINPSLDSSPSGASLDNDNLKLWLSELTHLSPQQVERVIAKREQNLLSPPLKEQ